MFSAVVSSIFLYTFTRDFVKFLTFEICASMFVIYFMFIHFTIDCIVFRLYVTPTSCVWPTFIKKISGSISTFKLYCCKSHSDQKIVSI